MKGLHAVPCGSECSNFGVGPASLCQWKSWHTPWYRLREKNQEFGLKQRSCWHKFLHLLHIKIWLYKPWKRCIQCMHKTILGLDTSQTTHEANDHWRHTSAVDRKHPSFAKNSLFSLSRLMNSVVKVFLKCVIRPPISFCWTKIITYQ